MSELDRWNTRYAEADGHLFGEAPNAFLARRADLLKPGWSALAVADGDGRNGVFLAEQGLAVRSVDFSPVAQEKARRLAEARGVTLTFELADVAAYSWPHEAYDVVAAIFFQFLSPADRAVAFRGIADALRPGGLLLLEGYTPKQLEYGTGGPKAVEQLYTRALLEDAFAGFTTVSIEEYDAELDEGGAHSGMSALIALVGWK